MNVTVIIEKTPSGVWNAMAPELPVCGVLGADSEQEAIALMKEAVTEYLDDLKAKGQSIPTSDVKIIQVTAA